MLSGLQMRATCPLGLRLRDVWPQRRSGCWAGAVTVVPTAARGVEPGARKPEGPAPPSCQGGRKQPKPVLLKDSCGLRTSSPVSRRSQEH